MDSYRSRGYGGATASPSANSRRQALLIEAQSRVLSLEGEVSHLRQQLRAGQVRRGAQSVTTLGTSGEDNQVTERCHKVYSATSNAIYNRVGILEFTELVSWSLQFPTLKKIQLYSWGGGGGGG